MTEEIECTDCDGVGWIRSPAYASGERECKSCDGEGWRAPTQDELDNMAEDAYESQFEGEPPMSFSERTEMQTKRDAQWGVK